MAFLHKNTFETLTELPDEWKDDYFECDELIAPVIRALNLRGYKTSNCCAGHAYPSLGCAEFLPQNNKKPIKSPIYGTYYIEPSKETAGWYYAKFKSEPSRSSFYITFERDTVLPPPPKGFKLSYEWPKGHKYEDEHGNDIPAVPKIEKDFSNKTSDYSFYRLLLAALRRLLIWAEALPNITKVN